MKRIAALALILILMFALCSCGRERNYVSRTLINGDMYEIIDPETKVHYLIFEGYSKLGMAPRYDSEGNLMIGDLK